MASPATAPIRDRQIVRWIWTAVWAGLLTALARLAVLYHDGGDSACWLSLNTKQYVWGWFVCLFIWLTLFLGAGNVGRLLLLVCTIFIFYFLPDELRDRGVGTELDATHDLHKFYESLQSYKQAHPQEGYPQTLPKAQVSGAAQHYFMLTYHPSHSSATGPNDVFRIELIPRHDYDPCGYLKHSFSLFDDGSIHSADEIRPAGKTDPSPWWTVGEKSPFH